jgi:hypothetical protein
MNMHIKYKARSWKIIHGEERMIRRTGNNSDYRIVCTINANVRNEKGKYDF